MTARPFHNRLPKLSLLTQIFVLTCCYEFDVSPADQSRSCRPHQLDKKRTLDYSLLYDYLTGTGVHNFSESVTIGFLAAYGQAQIVLGALPLAVDAVNNDTSKLEFTNLLLSAYYRFV